MLKDFAKECAVVTHHRLMNNPNGPGVVVDPEAKLEEELIVRPTSETIIWNTYRDWIKSYRDLPIFNQPMGKYSSLGNADHVHFYVQPSFYGRKVILLMPLRRKLLRDKNDT